LSNDHHWSNVATAGVQIVGPPAFYSSLNPDTVPSPTSGSSASTITAEFVETVTVGGSNVNPLNPFCAGLHQIVQLYR
jgi:hypothetical protein